VLGVGFDFCNARSVTLVEPDTLLSTGCLAKKHVQVGVCDSGLLVGCCLKSYQSRSQVHPKSQ
jgi:hypothetical protein